MRARARYLLAWLLLCAGCERTSTVGFEIVWSDDLRLSGPTDAVKIYRIVEHADGTRSLLEVAP